MCKSQAEAAASDVNHWLGRIKQTFYFCQRCRVPSNWCQNQCYWFFVPKFFLLLSPFWLRIPVGVLIMLLTNSTKGHFGRVHYSWRGNTIFTELHLDQSQFSVHSGCHWLPISYIMCHHVTSNSLNIYQLVSTWCPPGVHLVSSWCPPFRIGGLRSAQVISWLWAP